MDNGENVNRNEPYGSSISGEPLYKTTATPHCCTDLSFTTKTEKAEFHPHAVVITTKHSCFCGAAERLDEMPGGCCGGFSTNKSVIPRYKITDFEVGSGRRSLPRNVYYVLAAGIFLIFISSVLIANSNANANNNDDQNSNTSGSGAFSIILLLIGIGMVILMTVYITILCFQTEHYYILKYSNGRSNYSFFSSKSEKTIESNEKPNEDFLYSYVYDTMEKAKDTAFLHRFSHLNQAGLMEANKDKETPDELRTLIRDKDS